MGGIGGMFGLSGGAGGSGFADARSASLTPGTNAGQLNTAYDQNQSALAQQGALLDAIKAQNGLQNQSQNYNQLQGVINGTGPNPAQAMLNQATGQNVSNQAALMAGQRGAGANVGLMARQAGQAGGNIQQQAAGQGAVLQANQSLNALGQAGQMANTMAGNQIGQTNANQQSQLNEQQLLQNANAAYNNAQVGMQSNINSANAGLANTQLQGQQKMIGGIMNGAGAAMGKPPAQAAQAAQGGLIGYASGGQVAGPQSSFGQFLSGMGNGMGAEKDPLEMGASSFASGIGNAFRGAPTAPAQVGTQYSNGPVQQPSPSMGQLNTTFAKGGNVGSKLKSGGHVPGPVTKGPNDTKNDTVKALLTPGESVIDKETMQDPGPVGAMARTLTAIITAKKKGKK